MISNLSRHHIAEVTRQALQEGLIREEDTAVLFQDLDYLAARIAYLTSCFPPTTLHGLAIKSNPLLRILEHTRKLGTGVEAATAGEIHIALKAGYLPDRIVFDSPVKTLSDLRFALETGIHLNCDNLDELKRVDSLLKKMHSTSTIGIRINPQVGVGSILESSVAGEYSKFGVPVTGKRKELEEAFLSYPWLTGVHLHVGSQGCAMELLVNGVGVLYDFALLINEKRKTKNEKPISIFDIGGGLPISYFSDQAPPLMEDYVAALKDRAPGLFQGTGAQRHRGTKAQGHNTHKLTTSPPNWRIITEFGRWVYGNSGWTVSRVEYVKRDPGVLTAMIHVGADLFVRECLNPADWHHEYSVLDAQGRLKEGVDDLPYHIAGPLCFAGDIVARDVPLPPVEEGDSIVIHDTGGYTFSMWSRYNSRQTPRILGVREGKLLVLKERERLEEVVEFWE
ncbi:MAG: diaminopimelate decarboxylase [Bacteroidetes bacterium]|nr:MAG: diaminopimelate decarboxylase [Bacteroidota bacterium]